MDLIEAYNFNLMIFMVSLVIFIFIPNNVNVNRLHLEWCMQFNNALNWASRPHRAPNSNFTSVNLEIFALGYRPAHSYKTTLIFSGDASVINLRSTFTAKGVSFI